MQSGTSSVTRMEIRLLDRAFLRFSRSIAAFCRFDGRGIARKLIAIPNLNVYSFLFLTDVASGAVMRVFQI